MAKYVEAEEVGKEVSEHKPFVTIQSFSPQPNPSFSVSANMTSMLGPGLDTLMITLTPPHIGGRRSRARGGIVYTEQDSLGAGGALGS